jgi:hypothetical protein
MATKIIPKKSTVAAKVPLVGDLDQGELAINLTDKKIYTKDGSNNIIELSPNYDTTTSSTGYFKVSVGTTAQRPTPSVGMVRYNTTRGCFEGYTGSGWVNMSPLTIGNVGNIV